jgi:hypothetical protein
VLTTREDNVPQSGQGTASFRDSRDTKSSKSP